MAPKGIAHEERISGHGWDHESFLAQPSKTDRLLTKQTQLKTVESLWLVSPDTFIAWDSLWLACSRHNLKEDHATGFSSNGDRLLPSINTISLDGSSGIFHLLCRHILPSDSPAVQTHCLNWLHVLHCVSSVWEPFSVMLRDRTAQRFLWRSFPPWEKSRQKAWLSFALLNVFLNTGVCK